MKLKNKIPRWLMGPGDDVQSAFQWAISQRPKNIARDNKHKAANLLARRIKSLYADLGFQFRRAEDAIQAMKEVESMLDLAQDNDSEVVNRCQEKLRKAIKRCFDPSTI